MVFESVRGYIEVASGLTELTRARAMEAAHGLLSLPASGIATSGKVAVQAAALADELMAAAAANRSNLRALVRSEVDVAVTKLGLVPVQKLEEAQSEAARLRAEVSRLRSASATSAVPKGPAKRSAARTSSAKKAAVRTSPAKKSAVRTGPAKKAAVRTSPAKTVATPRGEAQQAAGGPATPTKAAAGTSPAKTIPVPQSAAKQSGGGATTPKKSAVRKSPVKRVAVPRSPAKKAAAGTSAARKSAVTTRGKPAGT